jgi:nicotinamide-nucleotide amidase
MHIEIICTGDEVLTGATINSNFSHISQRLGDGGFGVRWGTTVGDDRETLLEAFTLASRRAEVVVVNGGLGPTVDDLSQEVAARAAGVELKFDSEWFARMEDFFRRRARVMPPSNRKQAMLPVGAEVLDNPVGTACGFALDIGKARFFFTPGVPREMHKMLDEQIIPRLRARSGVQTVSFLKRFHSYGIGESHADTLLADVQNLAPVGSVKLGFRAHYPQLETKLTVHGSDLDDARCKLEPVEQEVRKRLGNFILAEDDQKLEGVILEALAQRNASLSIVETLTGGAILARIAPLVGAEKILRRGIVVRNLAELGPAVGVDSSVLHEVSVESAAVVARAALQNTDATIVLAVLVEIDEGVDRIDLGGTICLVLAIGDEVVSRRSRMLGGREWIRLGAVEMALDCLRRYLQGLRTDEQVDFEKT